jgi:uncharacterized protein YneF (UPF0154 family)
MLETIANISSIIAALAGILTVGGVYFVYKKVSTRQENNPQINVNGDAVFDGSFNASNNSNVEVE